MHGQDISIFRVARHLLHVVGKDGRWVVTVDGASVEGWFTSRSAAWTAGVTEADRLDRMRDETVTVATSSSHRRR
jgi:hypothetical protein